MIVIKPARLVATAIKSVSPCKCLKEIAVLSASAVARQAATYSTRIGKRLFIGDLTDNLGDHRVTLIYSAELICDADHKNSHSRIAQTSTLIGRLPADIDASGTDTG